MISREVLRFLVAGTLTTATNWAAGIVLAGAIPFEIAVVAAYLVGMTAGFVLYKYMVFPPSDRPLRAQIRGFVAVNLGGLFLVWVISVALMRWVMPETLLGFVPGKPVAHGLAIGVSCFVNYIGHRRLTFRSTRTAALVG